VSRNARYILADTSVSDAQMDDICALKLTMYRQDTETFKMNGWYDSWVILAALLVWYKPQKSLSGKQRYQENGLNGTNVRRTGTYKVHKQ